MSDAKDRCFDLSSAVIVDAMASSYLYVLFWSNDECKLCPIFRQMQRLFAYCPYWSRKSVDKSCNHFHFEHVARLGFCKPTQNCFLSFSRITTMYRHGSKWISAIFHWLNHMCYCVMRASVYVSKPKHNGISNHFSLQIQCRQKVEKRITVLF